MAIFYPPTAGPILRQKRSISLSQHFLLEHIVSGISSEVATPDPIPNSAVKHFSTDDISVFSEKK